MGTQLLLLIWIFVIFQQAKAAGLVRPRGSVAGLVVAISVPAELPHRKVFVSYYFESAYGEPIQASDIIPGPFKESFPVDLFEGRNSENVSPSNQTVKSAKPDPRKVPPPLLSRNYFYKMFENRLEYSGFNSTACLLRLICEINEFPIGGHNGVLGDVLQIMFSPSTSKDSDGHILPNRYHEAELRGRAHSCEDYLNTCPSSLIDLVTKALFV